MDILEFLSGLNSPATTIGYIATAIALLGGLFAYLIHHPAPRKDKWKVISCAVGSLLLIGCVLVIPPHLWPKTTPSHANQRSAGKLIYTDRGHNGDVSSIVWSPDGKRLASGSWTDGTIQIWDATTGANRQLYHDVFVTVPVSGVGYLAWSPDGKYLASETTDTVEILEATTGKKIAVHTGFDISGIGWSPDGQYLAFGNGDGTVHIWDVFTGKDVLVYNGHAGQVVTLTWSPDGRLIASASDRGVLQVWFTTTGKEIETYNCHCSDLSGVSWSPNGQYIAFATAHRNANEIELDIRTTGYQDINNGGNTLTCSFVPGGIYTDWSFIAWSPNSEYFAFSCSKTIYVWNINSNHEVLAYNGHSTYVTAIAWSPDSRLIASGSSDGVVEVWQAV